MIWFVAAVFAGIQTTLSSAVLKVSSTGWYDHPNEMNVSGLPTEIYYCVGVRKWTPMLGRYILGGIFVFLLSINVMTTVKITVQLSRRNAAFTTTSTKNKSSNSRTSHKARDHVARMVIVNSVIFFLLYSTVAITSSIKILEVNLGLTVLGIKKEKHLLLIGYVSAMINSSIIIL